MADTTLGYCDSSKIVRLLVLPTPMAVTGVGSSQPYVCLPSRTISQKPMQLRSPNFIYRNVPRWVLETHLFWVKRSKVEVTSHKQRRRGSLHSCECWLFLVVKFDHHRFFGAAHFYETSHYRTRHLRDNCTVNKTGAEMTDKKLHDVKMTEQMERCETDGAKVK